MTLDVRHQAPGQGQGGQRRDKQTAYSPHLSLPPTTPPTTPPPPPSPLPSLPLLSLSLLLSTLSACVFLLLFPPTARTWAGEMDHQTENQANIVRKLSVLCLPMTRPVHTGLHLFVPVCPTKTFCCISAKLTEVRCLLVKKKKNSTEAPLLGVYCSLTEGEPRLRNRDPKIPWKWEAGPSATSKPGLVNCKVFRKVTFVCAAYRKLTLATVSKRSYWTKSGWILQSWVCLKGLCVTI